MDTWGKETCPKCKKLNWYCHGNLEDLTQHDVEQVKCWGCGYKFLVVDGEDIFDEEPWTVDGHESAQ